MDDPKVGDWITPSCYVADKIGDRLTVIVLGVGETREAAEVRGQAIRRERRRAESFRKRLRGKRVDETGSDGG